MKQTLKRLAVLYLPVFWRWLRQKDRIEELEQRLQASENTINWWAGVCKNLQARLHKRENR